MSLPGQEAGDPTDSLVIRRVALAAFTVSVLDAFLVLTMRFWKTPYPPPFAGGELLLLVFAMVIAVASSLRQWPIQNCIVILGGLGGIGAGALFLSSQVGFPLGECLSVSPWYLPFVFIIRVLISRGAAQRLLRSWRNHGRYGYWLLGITGVLIFILGLAFEIYTAGARQYWRRSEWGDSIVWTLGGLAGLIALTPWLVKKRPGAEAPSWIELGTYLLLLGFMFAAAGTTWLH